MKRNVGNSDRTIRAVLAVVLGVLGIAYGSLLAIIVAAVLFLTAIFATCPLYSLLGVSTAKKDKSKEQYAG